MVPLAVGLALGTGGPFQGVALVTGKADNIVVVEAVPYGTTIDRASRMTTSDRYELTGEKNTIKQISTQPTIGMSLSLHSWDPLGENE